MTSPKKQYGLILKKENAALSTGSKISAAFFDDDEEVIDTQVMSSENASASTMRIRMQARREHERAIAEDPSVFQYDEIYEQLQAVKDAKQSEQKMADKEKKPKYVEQLLKAHKRRQVEQQLRDERKQEKEREAEGEMYKDKEVFVTGAYRKQMEEAQELGKELAIQDRIDDLTAVEKQKFWQAGFHRTVLHDISRDVEAVPSTSKIVSNIKTEIMEESEVDTVDHGEKLKFLRRKVVAAEDDILSTFKDSTVKVKPKIENYGSKDKKSIYSDYSEEESLNEETKIDLKPGLNILSRQKKLTKAEQLRSRFTPSESDSDEELRGDQREHYRRRSKMVESKSRYRGRGNEGKHRHSSRSSEEMVRKRDSTYRNNREFERDEERRRRRKNQDQKENSRDVYRCKSPAVKDASNERGRRKRIRSRSSEGGQKERSKKINDEKKTLDAKKKMTTSKPKTREERLEGLKQILKQRNGEKEIAEYLKRYLERKESGFVTLPL